MKQAIYLLILFVTAQTLLASEKPNIIFILADDLGQGDLGCYGQQKIKTPNLDALAAQGTRFTQAYSGTTILRQPSLAYWPGTIPAGRVTDEPWAFWDFLPTCAELSGATYPADYKPSGFSLVSFLKGGAAPQREYFYWELHEGNPKQAIRLGNWKAVRNSPKDKIELYDLSKDTAEQNDLAESQPEKVKQAEQLMTQARVDDPNWPLKEVQKKGKK